MDGAFRRILSTPWRMALAALGVAAVLAASFFAFRGSVTGWIHSHQALPVRFCEVAPGKLYRSGQPSESQLAKLFDSYGIRTILILRDEDYPELEAELRMAKARGAKVVRIPFSSTRPIPPGQLAEIRQVYADESGYPILVHCENGVARTGLAVALWRIEKEGWPGSKAVQEMIDDGYPVRERSVPMRNTLRDWKRTDTPPTPDTATTPPAAIR